MLRGAGIPGGEPHSQALIPGTPLRAAWASPCCSLHQPLLSLDLCVLVAPACAILLDHPPLPPTVPPCPKDGATVRRSPRRQECMQPKL